MVNGISRNGRKISKRAMTCPFVINDFAFYNVVFSNEFHHQNIILRVYFSLVFIINLSLNFVCNVFIKLKTIRYGYIVISLCSECFIYP